MERNTTKQEEESRQSEVMKECVAEVKEEEVKQ